MCFGLCACYCPWICNAPQFSPLQCTLVHRKVLYFAGVQAFDTSNQIESIHAHGNGLHINLCMLISTACHAANISLERRCSCTCSSAQYQTQTRPANASTMPTNEDGMTNAGWHRGRAQHECAPPRRRQRHRRKLQPRLRHAHRRRNAGFCRWQRQWQRRRERVAAQYKRRRRRGRAQCVCAGAQRRWRRRERSGENAPRSRRPDVLRCADLKIWYKSDALGICFCTDAVRQRRALGPALFLVSDFSVYCMSSQLCEHISHPLD
jgi:hypothetical protein